jgi:hypothetical protein
MCDGVVQIETDTVFRSIIKELAPIHAADFTRIIPCHGDVIEREGKVAWDKVWGAYK